MQHRKDYTLRSSNAGPQRQQAVSRGPYGLCLGLTVLLALALGVNQAFAQRDWLSSHYTDHPLAGTIWTSDLRPVSAESYEEALRAASFLLLGEIHNNPDHHRLQAEAVETLVEKGRRPALVFEMIPAQLEAALQREIAAGLTDAAKIGEVLRWQERGWPDWVMYQPIAEVALSAKLPMLAGELARDVQKAVARSEPSPEFKALAEELGLTEALTPEANNALEREIADGHCGLLPAAAIGPMVKVQRARDGQLAKSMLSAVGEDGAILIAGSGHVRNDWGVPALIRRTRPDASILSVAFLEVDPDRTSASDYTQAITGLAKPYDLIYFTPRADLTDHCAEMKKHMETRKSDGVK